MAWNEKVPKGRTDIRKAEAGAAPRILDRNSAWQGNSAGPVRAYPLRTQRPEETLLSPFAGPEGIKHL
ncbi:hypothetical protein TNCV_906181 [Trichonephila clavipes]|nr:hypothetical protein TNCV_906181 [Trichonephila clavipes]